MGIETLPHWSEEVTADGHIRESGFEALEGTDLAGFFSLLGVFWGVCLMWCFTGSDGLAHVFQSRAVTWAGISPEVMDVPMFSSRELSP